MQNTYKNDVERDLYLRKVALGEIEGEMTGYPSIDKPWLKYYSEEAINAKLPECTIYEYLWENNKDHLDDVALNYFDRTITYKKLFENIEKTASAFVSLGITKGDIVTIQSLSLPQVIYMLYALSKIGAVANMIYATSTPKEVIDNLTQTKSKMYVVIDSIYAKLNTKITTPYLKNTILLSVADEMPLLLKIGYNLKNKTAKPEGQTLNWKSFLQYASKNKVPVTGCSSDVVTMVYTGGTTGKSKGVMLSNFNLNAGVLQCKEVGCFERQKVFLSVLPPFVVFGLMDAIFAPLTIGLVTVLGVSANPLDFSMFVEKYKPNYIICGTAQAEKMLLALDKKAINLSCLEWFAVGGDTLSPKQEQTFNEFLKRHNSKIKLSQGYSMSETSAATVCSAYTLKKIIFKQGTVGIPLVHTNIKVVDVETNVDLPYNMQGEICMNSPCIMMGYYQNKEETNNVIKSHKDGQRWIHTGVLGSIDEDGFITIVGRIKRMILTSENDIFHKVFPKILEDAFLKLDSINAISIVVKPNKETINDLIAFVVLEEGISREHALSAIQQFAKDKLESFERPVAFIFEDKLPLTTIGKVDYRALEKEAEKL